MERLTQTSNSGGIAFTFDLDITCQPSEMKKILKIAEKLKCYEDAEEHGNYGKWIPVSERLPEEYDSRFKKYKGTYEWKPFMFEKHSKTVLVTIKYSDGEMRVENAKTIDGQWSINAGVIIAWMPLPEPYRESEV